MKTLLKLTLASLALILTACSTTSSLSSVDDIRAGSSTKGIILISAGRTVVPGMLSVKNPFIDYKIYSISSDGEVSEGPVHTIYGEPTSEALRFPRGHVGGKSQYVFVHLFELEAGEYLISSMNAGSRAMAIPSGNSVIFIPGQGADELRHAFKFTVEANKLNYIGGLLTTSRDLENPDSIKVVDEYERDLGFAESRNPEISELPHSRSVVVPVLEKE